jgi:hypothetical protein
MMMTPLDQAIEIPFNLDRDCRFWNEVERISQQQAWSFGLTLLQLARHGARIYDESDYDRDEMELIIKGVPID